MRMRSSKLLTIRLLVTMKFQNKKMIKLYLFIFLVLLPIEVVFAAEKNLVKSVIVNLLPIILFIGVWIYLMKNYAKNGREINKEVAESNDRLAEQIKRIADHLEKNS